MKNVLFLGVPIDTRDEFGCTALHIAALVGSLEIIKILLENGSDINATNKDGWNALHYAARYSNGLTVKFLLKTGLKYGFYKLFQSKIELFCHTRVHS